MRRRRSIWPTYTDRSGNIIPRPAYQSNFTENLKKTWKTKNHLPKPKTGKKKPKIPAYPIKVLLKEWVLFILFAWVLTWFLLRGFLA